MECDFESFKQKHINNQILSECVFEFDQCQGLTLDKDAAYDLIEQIVEHILGTTRSQISIALKKYYYNNK